MSQQINLFNPVFLKQKKHFSARTMLQGLALIFAGAILVAVYARLQLGALESQAAAAARQVTTTKAQLAKVSAEYAPRQKSKALEEELQRLEAEIQSQREALEIVQGGRFGGDKGYAEYFRAFSRQIVSGLWLTGFSISGADGDIEIRGRALQPELIPAYINRLKQEPVMQGKSFSNLAVTTPEVDVSGKEVQSGAQGEPQSRAAARFVEFILKSSSAEPTAKEGAANQMVSPITMQGVLGG